MDSEYIKRSLNMAAKDLRDPSLKDDIRFIKDHQNPEDIKVAAYTNKIDLASRH